MINKFMNRISIKCFAVNVLKLFIEEENFEILEKEKQKGRWKKAEL